MGGMAVELEGTRAPAALADNDLTAALKVAVQKDLGNEFRLQLEFAIASGFTIIFGASGAGKTTLLDCVAGLLKPDLGRIEIGRQIVFDSARRVSIAPQQRQIGYVFQDLALFPHLSAEDNVQYGIAKLSGDERRRRTDEILKSFRIAALSKRKPAEISGGERQRAALARALVTDPRVLLLDEPLSGLDLPTRSAIIEDLRAWNERHRIPILYVTHNRDEVFALGERVLVLENGRLIAQGTPHEVMTAPLQETVANLAGFENIFDAIVVATHEQRGTMTCRLAEHVELETPLVRAAMGSRLRVGIRAGDTLLATLRPTGLSAQNVIPGKLVSLSQHDVIVTAKVNCGVEFAVHLTLAARDSLQLEKGRDVWVVIKTHSCHLLAR